jgi:hypothetical protein
MLCRVLPSHDSQQLVNSLWAGRRFLDRSDEEVVAKSPKSAKASSIRGSSASLAAAGTGSGDGGIAAADSGTPKSGAGFLISSAAAAAAAAGDTGGGDALSRKRAYKEKWQEAVALFNTKPKKGIAMLQVRLRVQSLADVRSWAAVKVPQLPIW